MSFSVNFPNINPTLMIDCVNRSSLDSRVTFTRGSTATFVNSSGVITTAAANVPRFDHNPSTLQPLGLLIEEQRTNLFLQSQDFATSWTPNNTTVSANTVAAPDGTTTADTIVETTATGSHNIYQPVNVTSGSAYAHSVFVKKGNGVSARNFVQLGFQNAQFGSNSYANFDIVNGTVTVTGAGLTSASITSVGNNWWRCSIVDTATSSASTSVIISLITTGTGANQESYTGTTDANIFLWGAQLEAGAFPTSYIPTTTTALTRNADVASMTGTNFSSWYNQSEGTFFAEATSAWASGNIVGSSDGTNNNRIFLGIASGPASRLLITTLGSSVASITVPYTLNTVVKGAGAYKENSSQYAANGVLGVEDTVCTIPTVNRLSIGTNTTASDFFLNGYIRRLAFYPQRLPNTTLQALTT
jgi:hypothetical protein